MKKKSSSKKGAISFYKKIISVIVCFSLVLSIILPLNRSGHKLSTLPTRVPSQILLPYPLQLPTTIQSVLGAQTIEPEDVVKYINIERSKKNAHPLRMSQKLMDAARLRANVILKYQNFSHQDPYENVELLTVLPKVSYYYSYASENIGMGGISAEDFVGGFMHSTSHRENLLNPSLSDTGVAIVSGPYKQYYVNIVVQLFATPGSEDDYLGYSTKDSELYKSQLAILDAKLNPLVWNINKIISPVVYSDSEFRKLARKREILLNVYAKIKEKQPLENEQVAQIREYNQLL